ncbi:uncharacterized protein SEPMUDRAFT_151370 [Sphaerulina musiva SO2202]|uniref:Mid2 domain-containing protein n=1 Tax=Sphaerulina musiva (strain SO2202) TaxID=692275 RepID=N1QEB8_SPHMS|nr:uncharacterized protein SEPMUDRAFT_151370 [Sphaerulina musiva SO2202]EMF09287.1 hypothetical protein SEPMUDRAFT_151370 [Sphaerulina musiva SO2202]
MPSSHRLARALAAISVFITCCTGQQCYFPGGTESDHTPCASNGSPSACCASSAFCLENGLCLEQGILTRGSCTDKTWESEACAGYCRQESPGGSIAIKPCEASGSRSTFVCGLNNTHCRDSTKTFTLSGTNSLILRPAQVSALVAPILSSSSSSSATTLPTTSVQPSAEISSCPDAANGPYYTLGQMAGLGAGLGIPLFIAVCTAFMFWRKEHQRRPKLMYELPDDELFDRKPPPSTFFPAHPAVRSLSSREGGFGVKPAYDLRSFSPVVSPIAQGRDTPPHMHSFAERYSAMNHNNNTNSKAVSSITTTSLSSPMHEETISELDGQPVGSAFRFTTHMKAPGGDKEKNVPATTTIDLGNRTITTNNSPFQSNNNGGYNGNHSNSNNSSRPFRDRERDRI